jgi:hypothetical protein
MRPEDIALFDAEPIRRFMAAHASDDPAGLALHKRGDTAFPLQPVVEQIACRQKASRKLPSLTARGMLFAPDALEQASSEVTARFKASRIEGRNLLDCTAGLGVDAFAFAHRFASVTCCERDPLLFGILRRNMTIAGVRNIDAYHGDCLEFLTHREDTCWDWIYVDPKRRHAGRRMVALERCVPDVVGLHDLLLQKAPHVLIKASPALDPEAAVTALPFLSRIIEVSVAGECREMLCFLQRGYTEPPVFCAALLDGNGAVRFELCAPRGESRSAPHGRPASYWYEPDGAILRMRLEGRLAQMLGLSHVNRQTGYLTGDRAIRDFPGRAFVVCHAAQWRRTAARAYCRRRGICRANISRRDFPLAPEAIRSLLGLKEGGPDYLFFTRDHTGEKLFVHCRRYSQDENQE